MAIGSGCVRFELLAPLGSHVQIAGSFSDWTCIDLHVEEVHGEMGVYSVILELPSGQNQYKFIVNGQWISDPNCPSCISNSFGTTNSLVYL